MTDINTLTDPNTMLASCADPEVAQARAHQMIGGYAPAADDAEWYWNAHAERVFAALLHAAALDEERTAHDVADWLIDPDTQHEQIAAALALVERRDMLLDAQQFMTTDPRTRTSLCTTILTAQARATLAAQVVSD